ncbi:MAG: aldo/keto reductase [Cellvibrionales bacterium]|jgi:aryl-alcohol dehydrogenase-like predicted oxidoreductase|nr:aldo/keto reductase [Cellvibrionales bacterium]MBK8675085.1 aldo/keto reductase [Cellvibrionales bacterium]TXH49924.1 MAG: aldo/keto reductase [Cellvibrionales bacterium]HRG49918.1 aldo/keto reductase [Pseudomonadales bacterium]
MFYRALGGTGMQVSALGFGTVKLGRTEGVKYPQAFTVPDDKEARALLDLSRDLGINLIDTAPAYGNSEERLGKLLKADRKQWLICSKVGEEFSEGQSSFDFSAEHTRMSVERSLRRLQTDYIDMVLVHSDGNDLDIIQNSEALQTLAELKQRGWIRAFGMSTKTVAGGLLAAEQSDVVMVTYNLNEQADVAVLDYCREHNKGALIKKAFASGHRCDGDAVTEALAMIFSHAGASSAIVGTINPVHLRDNVQKLPKRV